MPDVDGEMAGKIHAEHDCRQRNPHEHGQLQARLSSTEIQMRVVSIQGR